MMPTVEVGELVTAPFEFTCVARRHRDIEEVRLAEVREVTDRRFRDGIRVELSWLGYCPCCGRRVAVEPIHGSVEVAGSLAS